MASRSPHRNVPTWCYLDLHLPDMALPDTTRSSVIGMLSPIAHEQSLDAATKAA
jgi:hypothetical protein